MVEKPKKPALTLTQRLAQFGGLILAIAGATAIPPLIFPKEPGQGFSIARVICAGVVGGIGGGIGAAIGFMVGRLLEGTKPESAEKEEE